MFWWPSQYLSLNRQLQTAITLQPVGLPEFFLHASMPTTGLQTWGIIMQTVQCILTKKICLHTTYIDLIRFRLNYKGAHLPSHVTKDDFILIWPLGTLLRLHIYLELQIILNRITNPSKRANKPDILTLERSLLWLFGKSTLTSRELFLLSIHFQIRHIFVQM